jgi:hypothetical protein
LFERRRRTHQTIAPTITPAARMPNAIQPHCVVSPEDSFCEAIAAPVAAAAAGDTPVVVVVVDVAGVVVVTVVLVTVVVVTG